MEFSDWLKDYLLGLSSNVDTVFVEYIHGLLQDNSMDKTEKLECISEFLSSVTSSEKATTGSSIILEHFAASFADSEEAEPVPLPTATTAGGHNAEAEGEGLFDSLASQMRSLLQQPPAQKTSAAAASAGPVAAAPAPPKERDACTIAALRAAGVVEYQDSEESKSALQVALADAEFFAKQPHVAATAASGGGLAPPPPPVGRKGAEPSEGLPASPDTEVIQLEEVEDAAGYGKKGDVKPGNVLDALATLNPHQFASSQAAAVTATTAVADLKAGRVKRLPTPGDISSSTPAYLIMSRTYRSAAVPASSTTSATSDVAPSQNVGGSSEGGTVISSASSGKKKKPAPPPTKHLADIGARAEEKQLRMAARKNEKLCNVPVAGRQRLDDMDAFFISDDDEDGVGGGGKLPHPTKSKAAAPTTAKAPASASTDILYEGGGNRERVLEAEKVARAKAAQEHALGRDRDKIERAKQLEAQANRKQAAQQKAQKQERRRR